MVTRQHLQRLQDCSATSPTGVDGHILPLCWAALLSESLRPCKVSGTAVMLAQTTAQSAGGLGTAVQDGCCRQALPAHDICVNDDSHGQCCALLPAAPAGCCWCCCCSLTLCAVLYCVLLKASHPELAAAAAAERNKAPKQQHSAAEVVAAARKKMSATWQQGVAHMGPGLQVSSASCLPGCAAVCWFQCVGWIIVHLAMHGKQ